MSEQQFNKVSGKWQRDYDQLSAEIEELQQRLDNSAGAREAMDRIQTALEDFAHTFQALEVVRQREILQQLLDKLTLEWTDDHLLLKLKIRFLPEAKYELPRFRSRPESGLESLTNQELALAKLLGDGLDYKDISNKWDVTPSLPRTLLARMKKKTGIRDTEQLIAAAWPYVEKALPRLPLEGRMVAKNHSASRFTPREKQVMDLLVEGKSYKQVADELSITYSCVANMVYYVRRKLDVETTDEAIQ